MYVCLCLRVRVRVCYMHACLYVYTYVQYSFIFENMQDKPPADTAATGGYKKFKKYMYLCLYSENVKGLSG